MSKGMSLISWCTLMLWMPFGLIGLAASKAGRHVLDSATNHEIALWKPVPWLIIMAAAAAAAAGCAAGSVVGRRASLLLFLLIAALGDLGKLPSLPTSVALTQSGCVLSAFAVGAMLARWQAGRDPAARVGALERNLSCGATIWPRSAAFAEAWKSHLAALLARDTVKTSGRSPITAAGRRPV